MQISSRVTQAEGTAGVEPQDGVPGASNRREAVGGAEGQTRPASLWALEDRALGFAWKCGAEGGVAWPVLTLVLVGAEEGA